jgi:hypothetical protein
MIVYQGLLPHLQMSLSFFYGTWSDPVDSVLNASDSIKRVTNAGDGVGMLYPATDWETAIIKIPDSVNLPGVTGLIFAIGNATGGPGKTSPVGHLKIARIALLINATIPVKYQAASKNTINNRYMFTPAGGNVSVTAFSLKGEELFNRNVTVKAGMKYSIRQFMRGTLGLSASQVRLVKIKGEGVNVSTKMW